MSIAIPGLPEGVLCTKVGIPTSDEFHITRQDEGRYAIEKGNAEYALNAIVVVPAPDFEFIYSIRDLTFRPVKKLAQPIEITSTVKFKVTNGVDAGRVQDALAALKELPGFVGTE